MALDIIKEDDLKNINKILSKLREEAEIVCNLLVDRGGHILSYQGFTDNFDIISLAALAAGSFASTKEIAKLVGEPEFTVMFHQGKKEHIHIGLISDSALLVIIFDDRTTIGMVRVYANQYTQELGDLLDNISDKNEKNEKIISERQAKKVKIKEDSTEDNESIGLALDAILPED